MGTPLPYYINKTNPYHFDAEKVTWQVTNLAIGIQAWAEGLDSIALGNTAESRSGEVVIQQQLVLRDGDLGEVVPPENYDQINALFRSLSMQQWAREQQAQRSPEVWEQIRWWIHVFLGEAVFG